MSPYTVEREPRRRLVTLHVDLTATVVPSLQQTLLADLIEEVGEVVFDLGVAEMIDSTGIGLLIATANTLARRQGRVQVWNVSPDILRLLRSMRLTQRLEVRERATEAHHG